MNARKTILYIVLLVVAANLALMVIVFAGTMAPPPSAVVLPKPNGHDDFVRAEKMLTTTVATYTNLTVEKLRQTVAVNAPALAVVRTGLTHECAVPIEDLKGNAPEHTAELNSFKLLVLAFSAEAGLAGAEHRTTNETDSWLNLIQFSQAFGRGGAFIDVKMSELGESFGLDHLMKLTNGLDAKTCAHIARTLEDIDNHSEGADRVVSEDKIYAGKLTFKQSLSQFIHFRRTQNLHQFIVNTLNNHARKLRETMAVFAARAYELDKGKSPANFSDLVPAYLKTVPQNPGALTNLDYRF